MLRSKNFGGAAIEYIIVTTFASMLSLAALGFISTQMKDRLEQLSNKYDWEIDWSELPLLGP